MSAPTTIPGNPHLMAASRDLRAAQEVSLDDGHAQLEATSAVARATLAVAFEQRTANLIALYLHIEDQGDMPDHAAELFREIASRLGLTDGGAS